MQSVLLANEDSACNSSKPFSFQEMWRRAKDACFHNGPKDQGGGRQVEQDNEIISKRVCTLYVQYSTVKCSESCLENQQRAAGNCVLTA